MAIVEERSPEGGGKVWSLCRMPFWQGSNSSSSFSAASASASASARNLSHYHHQHHTPVTPSIHSYQQHLDGSHPPPHSSSVSTVARSLLPTRRRLRLDPPAKLFFPYEPGKQVRSAIRIKNTSKSHVAFKFQTTAPKSCFMRPPGGILSPGETLVATVFKFVEHPENNEKQTDQKSKVKFRVLSLKVREGVEYVQELFDEQKDQVAVEQILRVVFLDVDHPSPAMEKLNRQLAEAEAAVEARKKPPEDTGPRIVGEGLVIDEWKERREKYLAKQQVEGVDSA